MYGAFVSLLVSKSNGKCLPLRQRREAGGAGRTWLWHASVQDFQYRFRSMYLLRAEISWAVATVCCRTCIVELKERKESATCKE
jgi:hypothetical protein